MPTEVWKATIAMPNVEVSGLRGFARRSGLTAVLDRLDDQHFIAASLKFVRYALNLHGEAMVRKMFVHKMEVGR